MRKQRGFFLVLAVIFIFVMGLMGSVIAYLFANRSKVSATVYNGLQAFYLADSGLEAATRYITRPSLDVAPIRVSCGSVTGNADLTTEPLAAGQFTATASAPSIIFNTLSAGITSSSTSIAVTSAASFAPQGRILIDHEAINYGAISGNTFVGLTRGADGTLASSHASGVRTSQYQCSLDVNAAIPTIASPRAERELQWGVALQDGWAVGNRAVSNYTYYQWNGTTELAWTDESFASCGTTCRVNLNAISMLSNADGWAVGDRTTAGFLTFLRWSGSAWSPSLTVTGCAAQNLQGVSIVSSLEGWAVGARYIAACGSGTTYRYTLLKWNGTTWSLLTPSSSPNIPADNTANVNLNAVHVIDTTGNGLGNLGFAVGDTGKILQYNGTNWVAVTSPVATNLFGVMVMSSSEAWAVGASGDILRWNGTTWSLNNSTATQQLNAISMIDTDGDGLANFGVAVGNGGRIMTYNGSTWAATTSSGTNLFAVGVIDANDAWAAGASGRLTHWDGSVWTLQTSFGSVVNAMSFVAPDVDKTTGWKQVFG